MARIEKILLDSDDSGWYLEIETDEEESRWFRVFDDVVEALDKSLGAYRDWRAEGERARQSYDAHVARGEKLIHDGEGRATWELDDSDAYDLNDPKHPTYADRMLEKADRMLDARRMGA